MNVITDFKRKKTLEMSARIKLKEIANWNTSWAKDKNTGEKDTVNLIHCLVFSYCGDKELIYFPTEYESEESYKNYKEIAKHNRENDNAGKKYNNK